MSGLGRVGRNLAQRFIPGRTYGDPRVIDQIRRHTDRVTFFDADNARGFREAGSGEIVKLYDPMDIPLELDYASQVFHDSGKFKRRLLVVELWECV